jgi:parallel beta-helix repeat protein
MIRYGKLIIVVTISLSNLFASGIEVRDTIKSNKTWNADTIKVTGNVIVANGVTLTIGAGTYVEFQGKYKLGIKGRLLAEGTKKDSIIFTAKDTAVRWASIIFDSTSETNDTSRITYCRIDYSSGSFGGGICSDLFSRLVVSYSTITKNKASYNGGGVYCGKNSSPVLINNTISQNKASDGGGVGCYGASPTLRNNVISNNSATGKGGGVYCYYSSSPILTGNTITGNSAATSYADGSDDGGGGVYSDESFSTITGNTITDNNSLNDGGGVYYNNPVSNNLRPVLADNVISKNIAQGCGGGVRSNSAYPLLKNNTIMENTSWQNGGGICTNCIWDLIDNTITKNKASKKGGGVYFEYYARDIFNNVISGNTAGDDGGGMYFNYTSSSIINNTIIKNNSSGDGGGIYFNIPHLFSFTGNVVAGNTAKGYGGGLVIVNEDTSLILSSNTIVNNNASNGGAIRFNCPFLTILNTIIWNNRSRSSGEGQIYLSEISSSSGFLYCNIQDSLSTLTGPGSKNEYKGIFKNNINISPQFADSAGGDFSLLSISPCVNTGKPDTNNLGLPMLDIADKPRIFADRIDIGAYEFQDYPTAVNKCMSLINSPREFSVGSYPNPFCLKTSIRIRIPLEATEINTGITIFNVSGRMVKELYSGALNSGIHTFIWNGSGDDGKQQPAGYYIVSLQSGEMKRSLRILMIN